MVGLDETEIVLTFCNATMLVTLPAVEGALHPDGRLHLGAIEERHTDWPAV